MLGIKITGIVSYGEMTGLNSLDFWLEKEPSEFLILYEA